MDSSVSFGVSKARFLQSFMEFPDTLHDFIYEMAKVQSGISMLLLRYSRGLSRDVQSWMLVNDTAVSKSL